MRKVFAGRDPVAELVGSLRPSGPPPRPTVRGRLFDVSVAVVLWLLAVLAAEEDDAPQRVEGADAPSEVHTGRPEPFLPIEEGPTGWPLLMVAVVAPLVLRRRLPLAMLWTVMAVAPFVADYDAVLRLSFYCCVVTAYSAAVYSPHRIPALLSLPLAAFLYTRTGESAVPTIPDDTVPFLILVPIAVAADGLRRWRRRADTHRERLTAMERDREAALRAAAEQERARIARELHDVVTHSVSVMVIQAGAARKVMDTTPDRAREALLAVEAGGRAAMSELRHVMGLLTAVPGEDDSRELSPQPDLNRLTGLAARVREAGTPVELLVTGERRRLPPGVELAGYRVVQEALTNTVKHAAGAEARVVVDYGADRLRLEVTDSGGDTATDVKRGDGRGLLGLSERLGVYGGTLAAGPRPLGGYRVEAVIPLEVP
ncbi:sensor histidine kinase [Stackebrandtia albiflava]|uniref:sensor histidine kinase n=1 Tax=Stackebrandtia albiflava TaxID=406432 RepID=UPI001B870AD8|nr:histidine kinase [Stackebrandtia albiflava]